MLIWYLSRGAAITGYALLSVATAAGALTSRKTVGVNARVLTQYVHRSAALAGVVMLVLHIITIVADSYAGVGVAGAFIPFASGYRAVAVTFGVIGMYLLAAVMVTGMLRSRFTKSDRAVRQWRSIHLLAYAVWFSAALHFWTAGTDARQGWALAVLFSGVALVAGAVAVRLAGHPAERPMPVRIGGRA